MSRKPYAKPQRKNSKVVIAIGAKDSRLFSFSMLSGDFMLTKSKKVI
jgi:hypothetical protein